MENATPYEELTDVERAELSRRFGLPDLRDPLATGQWLRRDKQRQKTRDRLFAAFDAAVAVHSRDTMASYLQSLMDELGVGSGREDCGPPSAVTVELTREQRIVLHHIWSRSGQEVTTHELLVKIWNENIVGEIHKSDERLGRVKQVMERIKKTLKKASARFTLKSRNNYRVWLLTSE